MNQKNQSDKYFSIFLSVLAFLFLYIVQQSPLLLLNYAIKYHLDKDPTLNLFISIAFVIITILVTVIFICMHKRTQAFKDTRLTYQSWIYIIAAIIITLIVNFGLLPFMKTTGNENVAAQTRIIQSFPYVFYFFALIIAPITEEIIYRSYFINWFFKDHLYLGVMVGAILFGLSHLSHDPVYFLSKFLLGLVLGFVYIKNRNIKASMIVHFINNFLALI